MLYDSGSTLKSKKKERYTYFYFHYEMILIE